MQITGIDCSPKPQIQQFQNLKKNHNYSFYANMCSLFSEHMHNPSQEEEKQGDPNNKINPLNGRLLVAVLYKHHFKIILKIY